VAGVGFDISSLRPAKTPVTNAAGTSTGAVSFMHRFSNTTREVGQSGRRGALLLSMNVNHPDIEQFITSKDDLTKVTGANVSVKITDRFMEAVENGELYPLRFPAVEPETGKESQFKVDIDAKKLWDKIIHQAWKTAEPGVLFWDKVMEESPADCYEGFETISTNPCGEIPLCAEDSCRLGHMNLYSYVKDSFTGDAFFDFESFEEDVRSAQRLMDDIVDLEEEKINQIIKKIQNDPEPNNVKEAELDLWIKIKNKLLSGRRTGLGITGEADMLAALGIKYDQDEAIEFSKMVHKTLAITSYKSSIQMAKERGCFPVWEMNKEIGNPFIGGILFNLSGEEYGDYISYGRRNIANLTVAPTGTTSLMTQTSSGIEPVLHIQDKRSRKVEEKLLKKT
jgi:ribonucleoside-diphosphate reductase alpha chain